MTLPVRVPGEAVGDELPLPTPAPDGSEGEQPDASDSRVRQPRPWRRPSVWIAVFVPAVLYGVFIVHFAQNGIFWDDWTLVPIVDGVIHHHLSLSLLWAQHNENRMLVPYALVAAIGGPTHLDTAAIVYASLGLFVLAYLLVLGSSATFLRTAFGPWSVLCLGIVWFSIVDTENALWAFQIAWYLVLLGFTVLLFALRRGRVTLLTFCAALAAATLASFSSLQGLIVWPVGLLCLVWLVRDWRKLTVIAGVWLLSAVIVAVLYFRGFSFNSANTGGGSTSYGLHHPLQLFHYIVVLVGAVFPTTSPDIPFHTAVGGILFGMAVLVIISRVRSWSSSPSQPLPLLLVLFALLFDASIAVGRLSLGVDRALASRYTMANLLIVVAVLLEVFQWSQQTKKGAHSHAGHARTVAATALIVLLVGSQASVSTVVGLRQARSWHDHISAGDAVVVHLNALPRTERTDLFDGYVFPSLSGARATGWLKEVRSDHLGELAPGTSRQHPFSEVPGQRHS